MTSALIRPILIRLGAMTFFFAGLIFISAGTLHYWQAWLFLVCYFSASVLVTVYLFKTDPQLLARRIRGGPMAEKNPTQKLIMSLLSVCFAGLLVIPGLDHRYGGSSMSTAAVLTGEILYILGWCAVLFVFKENSFGSATIEVAENQKVISTGPYAYVRHPMYAGGLVLLLGIPILLGSWAGVLAFAALIPGLVWRLLDEEKFLSLYLAGYAEYKHAVPFRLLPGVW